jgi:hypothetical protein
MPEIHKLFVGKERLRKPWKTCIRIMQNLGKIQELKVMKNSAITCYCNRGGKWVQTLVDIC